MAGLIGTLMQDARELARVAGQARSETTPLKAATRTDAFRILALQRLRERTRGLVPGANHALRIVESTVYGIEIGRDVTIGRGVSFVHPIGIVIGGDARIGDRVTFYGSNTVGTAKDDGYPTIEDDVVLGAGARVLGPITVGRGAMVGANAVVLHDVPAGATVVGAPARAIGGGSDA